MTDPTSLQPGLNMTALSPLALTPPSPPALTASSLPDTGALSYISMLDVETCAFQTLTVELAVISTVMMMKK